MTAPGPPEPSFRTRPPRVADERTMLEAWLDYHRGTLLWKCDGLSERELKARSAAPSSLSLLGLVRHMAEVERGWFRQVFAREDVPDVYCTDEQPEAEFDLVDDADPVADVATFRAEVETCRAATAGRSVDETVIRPRDGKEFSLRWIYLHMIEEYARHNGHADLLRERIDGAAGD
jgi:uncharacterized damage-inducible protein DinB